ncbi:hypothetical protein EVI01_14810 [Enterococcus villorum]|uniref:Uncharacterized protein n=1 Tax=Enterococcus villorum TaxID=112904 RepID=A0A511J2G3_9ENTE|nr:hypothetical protein EVI01_14810 [Enterococcus villorum]
MFVRILVKKLIFVFKMNPIIKGEINPKTKEKTIINSKSSKEFLLDLFDTGN